MAARGRKNADFVLVSALASGRRQQDAAREAGVSVRTVSRRLEDPEFLRQIDAARQALVTAAVGQLTAASTDAVQTLRALLAAESEHVRLGAARAILEVGQRLREAGEIEERLARLEALAATTGARDGVHA